MATRKSGLRVVGKDEKPAPKVHKNIVDALEGSSRDVLASMRLTLAKKIDAGEVSSNSIASAYKELRELDRLIRSADQADREDHDHGDGQRRSFDASAI